MPTRRAADALKGEAKGSAQEATLEEAQVAPWPWKSPSNESEVAVSRLVGGATGTCGVEAALAAEESYEVANAQAAVRAWALRPRVSVSQPGEAVPNVLWMQVWQQRRCLHEEHRQR